MSKMESYGLLLHRLPEFMRSFDVPELSDEVVLAFCRLRPLNAPVSSKIVFLSV
jgi:hypothetical protein